MPPLPLLKPGLRQYEVVCLVRAGVQPAMRQTSAVQTDPKVRAAFSNELGMPYAIMCEKYLGTGTCMEVATFKTRAGGLAASRATCN